MTTFKKISELINTGYPDNGGQELIEIVAYTGVNSDIPTSQSLSLSAIFSWGFNQYLPLLGGIPENLVTSKSVIGGSVVNYEQIKYIPVNSATLDGGNNAVIINNIGFGNGEIISAQQWDVALLPVSFNFGKELSILLGESVSASMGKVISFKNVNFPESTAKTLRIVFNDLLDITQPLLASSFTLSGKYIHRPVFMDERTVGLRVENVVSGETLTLSIASGAVRDLGGNLVAASSGTAIINTGNKLNTTSLAVSLCALKNTTPSVVEIIFNQMLDLSWVLDPTSYTLSGGKTVISVSYKNTSTVILNVTTFTAGEVISLNIAANAVRALVRVGTNSLITGVAITNKVGATDSTPPAIATVSTVPQVFIDAGKPYYIHAGNSTIGVSDVIVLKKMRSNVWHLVSLQEGFLEEYGI